MAFSRNHGKDILKQKSRKESQGDSMMLGSFLDHLGKIPINHH